MSLSSRSFPILISQIRDMVESRARDSEEGGLALVLLARLEEVERERQVGHNSHSLLLHQPLKLRGNKRHA